MKPMEWKSFKSVHARRAIIAKHDMRIPGFISIVLLIGAFVTGCSQLNVSRGGVHDAMLQQKLVGQWAGFMPIGTNQVIFSMTTAYSNGAFSTQTSTYDNSEHLLHFVRMEGTFVVTNGAVVIAYTQSSDKDTALPLTMRPEPILRLDDHELEIVTDSGYKWTARKVSP